MKVRMLTLMAGPDGILRPDQVVDLPKKKAQALIDGGFAVKVAAPKPKPKKQAAPEKATAEPPENAAQPEAEGKEAGAE